MTGAELKPKQIKALLLLLVLVPLIPTVLMLAFLIDTVQTEKDMDRVSLESFYRQSLAAVVPSAQNRFLGFTVRAGASPAEIFAELIGNGTVDGALVYGTDGTLLYPEAAARPEDQPPSRENATVPRAAVAFSRGMADDVLPLARTPGQPPEQWREVKGRGTDVFALLLRRDGRTIVLLCKRETLHRMVRDFYRQAFDPAVKVIVLDGVRSFPPRSAGPEAEPVARGVVPGLDAAWQVLLYP